MPVAYNASNHVVTNSSSATIALTIATSACLLVMVTTKAVVGKSVSAVFANGVQMTQLARNETSNTNPIVQTLFGLTAAPSGVVSISANLVGAAAALALFAVSYTGNKATNPFDIATKATTSTAINNISISTSTNDMVVLFASNIGTVSQGGVNVTQREVDSSSFGVFLGDTAGAASSFSFSVSASMAASWSIALTAVNVRFSATVATSGHAYWRIMRDIGF